MEDAHVFTFDMPKHANSAFFGVFDGHAGVFLINLKSLLLEIFTLL